MDELVLPLSYNGTDMELALKMYAYGYPFRVEVMVGATAVIFEPDEEGSFRALVGADQIGSGKMLEQGLLGLSRVRWRSFVKI